MGRGSGGGARVPVDMWTISCIQLDEYSYHVSTQRTGPTAVMPGHQGSTTLCEEQLPRPERIAKYSQGHR